MSPHNFYSFFFLFSCVMSQAISNSKSERYFRVGCVRSREIFSHDYKRGFLRVVESDLLVNFLVVDDISGQSNNFLIF